MQKTKITDVPHIVITSGGRQFDTHSAFPKYVQTCVEYFKREPRSLLRRTTPRICAGIGRRIDELMNEVPAGSVN